MGRRSAYRVILLTHVEEAVAIVRILRSRARRRLAEAELARERWREQVRRGLLAREQQIGRMLGRMGFGGKR